MLVSNVSLDTQGETMRHYIPTIQKLGIKNQIQISRCLDIGLICDIKQLQDIDAQLHRLLAYSKKADTSTRISQYLWHSQGDGKVRPSHAANDGQTFSFDNPPPTGNPGTDFGCRCWAEPLNANQYSSQLLVTQINDSPQKWSDSDLGKRYLSKIGKEVTLSQIGYLQEVIDYYANDAIANDGKRGVYRAVNNQIINQALQNKLGKFSYNFNSTYDFGGYLLFPRVLFSLGNSTIKGQFNGESRIEEKFLVINGVITYNFSDKYTDPSKLVESTMFIHNMTREEAIEYLGGNEDKYGVPYDITDQWQTKFNATVKIPE